MDQPVDNIPDENRLNIFIGCNTGPDILSCYHLQIIEIVNIVFFTNIITLFGVITNIINIIVFFKHGFANAANVSFFSLAISDMCCQVTLLWVCMCLNPFINAAGVPWVPLDINDLPGGWPYVIFGRITSYITVFITAERCLSIITPLKVKQIITPKRATVIIILIYIINILTLVPEYATSYFEFKFFNERNATLLTIAFTSNRDRATSFVYFMSSFTGILSFVSVVIWTIILVAKIQQSSKWRQMASIGSVFTMSSRDKKAVKMVVMIACVLIVCYTPGTMASMATFIEPEIAFGKRYSNVCVAIWTISVVFQASNASVSIFLYYKMSSKYRRTFNDLFNRHVDNKATATTDEYNYVV